MNQPKYFDRGDHILEIIEHSPTERTKILHPKPHTLGAALGVAAATAIVSAGVPARRIATRRKNAPQVAHVCRHRGDQPLRQELVRCVTCQGNVRLKLAVHACEIFGECLPAATHKNESSLKGCQGCGRFDPSAAGR
jgi:hypothetical protein